jgi:hypothetical protein
MQFRQWTLSLGAAAGALSFAIAAQARATFDKVKQAGQVVCGVAARSAAHI